MVSVDVPATENSRTLSTGPAYDELHRWLRTCLTNSAEYVQFVSWSGNSLHFIQLESSLQCSQGPVICTCPQLDEFSSQTPVLFFNSVLIISSFPHLGFSSFPITILYSFLFCLIRAIWTANLSFYLTTLPLSSNFLLRILSVYRPVINTRN